MPPNAGCAHTIPETFLLRADEAARIMSRPSRCTNANTRFTMEMEIEDTGLIDQPIPMLQF
jgi:hypothetical protein